MSKAAELKSQEFINLKELILELERDIKGYNRTIKRHPEDSNVYYVKAGALTKLGQYTKEPEYLRGALECYSKAIALSPSNSLYLVDRSKLYLTMGKLSLAAQDIAQLQSDDTRSHDNEVLSLYIANTIQEVTKTLANQPQLTKTEITKKTQDFENIIKGSTTDNTSKELTSQETFERTKLADLPTLANASLANIEYNKAIDYYHNHGQLQEALKHLNKAIKLNPKHTPSYLEQANILKTLNQNKEALEAINIAVKLDANNPNAHYIKGKILSSIGNYEEAVNSFDQAISLNPEDPLYYCNKGRALNNLQQEQEALESFNKAFEITQINNFKKGMEATEASKTREAIEAKGTSTNTIKEAKEIKEKTKREEQTDNMAKESLSRVESQAKVTLLESREELLKKLTKLQESTTEVQKVIDKLDQSNPLSQKVMEQFRLLKKHKTELTNKVIDSINDQLISEPNLSVGYLDVPLTPSSPSASSSSSSNDFVLTSVLDQEALNEISKQKKQRGIQSTEIQKEADNSVLSEINQLTSFSIERQEALLHFDQVIKDFKARVNQEKINQEKANLNTETTQVTNATSPIQTNQSTDTNQTYTISKKDPSKENKQDIGLQINKIIQKVNQLSQQSDIKVITSEMIKLMNKAKITKGKLSDIEDDLDDIIATNNNRSAEKELQEKTPKGVQIKQEVETEQESEGNNNNQNFYNPSKPNLDPESTTALSINSTTTITLTGLPSDHDYTLQHNEHE